MPFPHSNTALGASQPEEPPPPFAKAVSSATQIGGINIPGTDPDRPRQINQDALFGFEMDGHVVAGVMDGHGLKGHVVTQFLMRRLPERIRQAYQAKVGLFTKLRWISTEWLYFSHAPLLHF